MQSFHRHANSDSQCCSADPSVRWYYDILQRIKTYLHFYVPINYHRLTFAPIRRMTGCHCCCWVFAIRSTATVVTAVRSSSSTASLIMLMISRRSVFVLPVPRRYELLLIHQSQAILIVDFRRQEDSNVIILKTTACHYARSFGDSKISLIYFKSKTLIR